MSLTEDTEKNASALMALYLAGLFKQNFAKFEKDSPEAILKADPLTFEDLSKK